LLQLSVESSGQGCQMVYFQKQNQNLGKFWRVLQWKILVYFMAIWSIFRPFGILLALWYILWSFGVFSLLCYILTRKIWQPCFWLLFSMTIWNSIWKYFVTCFHWRVKARIVGSNPVTAYRYTEGTYIKVCIRYICIEDIIEKKSKYTDFKLFKISSEFEPIILDWIASLIWIQWVNHTWHVLFGESFLKNVTIFVYKLLYMVKNDKVIRFLWVGGGGTSLFTKSINDSWIQSYDFEIYNYCQRCM
jgi:hypothetical protein